MQPKAVQDYQPEHIAHCFGCGRLNEKGLQLRSFWEGDRCVGRFKAQTHHTAYPGIINGGIIAAVIDCHSMAAALAAAHDYEGRPLGSGPPIDFVTGKLTVEYLKPTPLDQEAELVARVTEVGPRKCLVKCSLLSGGVECARGEVLGVRISRGES